MVCWLQTRPCQSASSTRVIVSSACSYTVRQSSCRSTARPSATPERAGHEHCHRLPSRRSPRYADAVPALVLALAQTCSGDALRRDGGGSCPQQARPLDRECPLTPPIGGAAPQRQETDAHACRPHPACAACQPMGCGNWRRAQVVGRWHKRWATSRASCGVREPRSRWNEGRAQRCTSGARCEHRWYADRKHTNWEA
jgi:hypothetical protein